MSLFHKAFEWSLDLIFPRYCLGCGKENSYICRECFEQIKILSSSGCFLCGRRSPTGRVCKSCQDKFRPALGGLLVASDWNNLLLRQLIYGYKYNFVKELSIPLSCLMISFLELTNFKNLKNDKLAADKIILVPVPLHKRRLLWRGFNQADLLIQEINRHFNIPSCKKVIERTRPTLPQVEIKNKIQRRQNVKEAFRISDSFDQSNTSLKNKTVILVDDVCTTSATLEECAKVLKPLKPKEIWGLVIARG